MSADAIYAHFSFFRLNQGFDARTLGIVMGSHKEKCEMRFTLKGILYNFHF